MDDLRVAVFTEDETQSVIVGGLIARVAKERGAGIYLDVQSAVRGHGRVVRELEKFLRKLPSQTTGVPDLIVAATDANCKGLNHRRKQMPEAVNTVPMVLAIPDPHVERWLLLDGKAFRYVLGKGCKAPDLKCDRGRYKHLLKREIHEAKLVSGPGGFEVAEDIVASMNIERAAKADKSFRYFVRDLRSVMERLKR